MRLTAAAAGPSSTSSTEASSERLWSTSGHTPVRCSGNSRNLMGGSSTADAASGRCSKTGHHSGHFHQRDALIEGQTAAQTQACLHAATASLASAGPCCLSASHTVLLLAASSEEAPSIFSFGMVSFQAGDSNGGVRGQIMVPN